MFLSSFAAATTTYTAKKTASTCAKKSATTSAKKPTADNPVGEVNAEQRAERQFVRDLQGRIVRDVMFPADRDKKSADSIAKDGKMDVWKLGTKGKHFYIIQVNISPKKPVTLTPTLQPIKGPHSPHHSNIRRCRSSSSSASKLAQSNGNVPGRKANFSASVPSAAHDTSKCSPAQAKKEFINAYGETYSAMFAGEDQVIKVLPLTSEKGNEPGTTSAEQAVAEVVVGLALTKLKDGEEYACQNFAPFNGVSVVEGPYPEKLLKAWQAFQDAEEAKRPAPQQPAPQQPAKKKGAKKAAKMRVRREPNPAERFDKHKLKFLVIRQGNGGEELEKYNKAPSQKLARALAIFFQACLALAVAEEKLFFEHRDLHIRTMSDSSKDFVTMSCGVKVSLIDDTWSRIEKDGEVRYGDYRKDPEIFADNDDQDQLAAYRAMVECHTACDDNTAGDGSWEKLARER
ncbi:haspin like kinase domain-containing protein [Ditylenchus destructor]|uniref:Haspin like kinase domain-containing protein n=1 Tax=Ditylenchus destructor TaxID=166010 RepID=A0AAD4MVR5_9BILA|nr:haspin like kinase domain-containing protein [Ditylenchus destructor]